MTVSADNNAKLFGAQQLFTSFSRLSIQNEIVCSIQPLELYCALNIEHARVLFYILLSSSA